MPAEVSGFVVPGRICVPEVQVAAAGLPVCLWVELGFGFFLL